MRRVIAMSRSGKEYSKQRNNRYKSSAAGLRVDGEAQLQLFLIRLPAPFGVVNAECRVIWSGSVTEAKLETPGALGCRAASAVSEGCPPILIPTPINEERIGLLDPTQLCHDRI